MSPTESLTTVLLPIPYKAPERQKMPNACDHCRQRKLRCDGSTPSCSNCALYEKPCHYVQGRNKSGPPKGFKRKKSDADSVDEAPRQRRRLSTPSPTLMASSCHQSSSRPTQVPLVLRTGESTDTTVSTRDISPASDSSSHSHTLSPSSHWITPVTMPSSGTAECSYSSYYPNQMPESFDDVTLTVDPIFASILSSPKALLENPFAQMNYTPVVFDNMQSALSIPPQLTAPNLVSQSYHSPAQHRPPVLAMPPNIPVLPGLLAAHAFVPLFPLPYLQQVIAACAVSKSTSIHASFFLNALEALSTVTILTPSEAPEPCQAYLAAQNQAMPAYFAVLSEQASSSSSSPNGSSVYSSPQDSTTYPTQLGVLIDDTTLTTAAMLYLTARSVFSSSSPTKESATWLRLARDMVEAPSFPASRKRWFARVGWLWGRGIVGLGLSCSQIGVGVAGIPAATEGVTDDGKMDTFQTEFDGLVSLVLDLESLLAEAKTQVADQRPDVGQLAMYVDVPLCLRVREWMQTSPLAQEALLQYAKGTEMGARSESGGGEDEVCVRETIGRVLHLIYYGMAVKFDYQDPARCSLRKTSMHVAVTRIVDAADWLISSQRTWLWAFAEPALLIARDYLFDRCGIPPSSVWSSPSASEVILSSASSYVSAITSANPLGSSSQITPPTASTVPHPCSNTGANSSATAFGYVSSSSAAPGASPPPPPLKVCPSDLTLLTLIQEVLLDASKRLAPAYRVTAAGAAGEIAWVLETCAAAQVGEREGACEEWAGDGVGAGTGVGVGEMYTMAGQGPSSSTVEVF
ncbi:hypothetical protein BKA93DRAFT_798790 [Sparassis latifolia]